MADVFQQMRNIQTATLAARARLADKTVGTQVSKGRGQVTRVTYDAKGRSTVSPASDWMPVAQLPAALDALTA